MKRVIIVFSILFISFVAKAQTDRERDIYEDSIATAVTKSADELVYYNPDDKVVGYRLITSTDTNYTDARKRSIVKRPIKQQVQSSTPSKSKTPSSSSHPPLEDVDPSQLTKIIRLNKIIYRYKDGSKAYVVRRHWWSKSRVTYFDSDGKRIGFKKQRNNGKVIYFDSKGRRTGESYLNASGQLIFKPEFQRETPGIMLTQFFFQ